MKLNLLHSCFGISFLLILIGFLFAGMIREQELFSDSSCYYDYLCDTLQFPEINPFYCKGRRWRHTI